MDEVFDVIILGAGAAGLTAGIYSSRARLSTLILNEGTIGGQMIMTDEIANYPGVETTKGFTVANIMKKQAKNFGCQIKSNIRIIGYNLTGNVKTVHLTDGSSFQAFEHAIQEAKKNPKISFIMGSELREIKGNELIEAVMIENLATGKLSEMKTDGVFIFIGYLPNTESLKDIVKTNDRNEIITDADMRTNIPGVFAAGDCIVKKYRQVTTAVADGTIAALSAMEYLRS